MLKTDEQKNILTPAQIAEYYKSQSGAANPLSPAEFVREPIIVSPQKIETAIDKANETKTKLTPQQYLAEGGALKDGQVPTEKIEPTVKEEEKTGGGYSFDEALQLFGQDFTGLHKLDDGTYEADTTALNRIGIKTEVEQGVEAQQQLDTAKVDIENLTTKLQNLDISKDPAFVAISQGIQNTWNDRISDMERANASRSASMTQLGIRYGSKYTGGSFETIVSEEERQGMDRVASLEKQKAAALANAEVAFRSQKWDEYVLLIEKAEKKYDKAVEELNTLNELAIERNKAFRNTQITNSILDFIGNGITDPLTIMQALGGQVDIKTITALTDEIITVSEDTGLDISQTTSDFQTFNYLKETDQLPVGVNTYDEYARRMAEVKRAPEKMPAPSPLAEQIPTFDEFVDEILQTPEGQSIIQNYEEQAQQTLMPNKRREVVANAVQDLYNQAVEATTPKEEFSSTEKKKLEQAGLSNASRQEQLNYLYGKTTNEFGFDDL